MQLHIVHRTTYEIARHLSIDDDNAYFASIRKRWGEALREVFVQLAGAGLAAQPAAHLNPSPATAPSRRAASQAAESARRGEAARTCACRLSIA